MKKIILTSTRLRKIIKEEVKKLTESFVDGEFSKPEYFDDSNDEYGKVWDALAEFADDPTVDCADVMGNNVVMYFADGHYETIMKITDEIQAQAAIDDWNESSR